MPNGWSIEETAEIYRVTPRTVLRWIKRGQPVARLLGGQYRFMPDHIAVLERGVGQIRSAAVNSPFGVTCLRDDSLTFQGMIDG